MTEPQITIVLPPMSNDYLSVSLRELTRQLNTIYPDKAAWGGLGGSGGYGVQFENETFWMFPYYWGDCVCDRQQKEWEWCKTHLHRRGCPYLVESGKPGCGPCDCGHDEDWVVWIEANPHASSCPECWPNFRCGEFEVTWYKYIGRGMRVNKELSRDEIYEMFRRCHQSLPT